MDMLAADKQLLDARLRDELQQLRVAELGNVVLRFQNILTPSTLIAGFSFTAIVELDFLPTGTEHEMPHRAEPIFYIAAASALSLSLFVTTIASTGIIFGQRLQVQSTAEQGSRHNQLVEELDSKFIQCLAALCTAMICVVVSAIAVVWVKQSYNDGEWHGTSITASIIVGVLFLWTSGACHAPDPARPARPPLTRTQSERALPSETPRTPPAPPTRRPPPLACVRSDADADGLAPAPVEGAHLDALAPLVARRLSGPTRRGGDDGRGCARILCGRGGAGARRPRARAAAAWHGKWPTARLHRHDEGAATRRALSAAAVHAAIARGGSAHAHAGTCRPTSTAMVG